MASSSSSRPSPLPPATGAVDAELRSYRFGRFTLDVRGQRLFRDAELVPMTSRVFDTLLALIRNRDRVVSKDELLHLVWNDTVVSEDSLTHNISILRRTFGDDPNHPGFIATNARRGYRFIADVTESASLAVPPGPAPVALLRAVATPAWNRRTTWITAGVAMAAGLAGAFLGGRIAREPAATPIRALFSVEAPAGTSLVSGGALSPDGRYLVFVARNNDSSTRRLWIRNTESGEMRAIDGSEGAWRAFWAPDSTALGFFAEGRIKRVGLDGRDPVRVIGTTLRPKPGGGSWSPAGVIVYAEEGSLYSIPAAGGAPTRLKRWGDAGNEFVWLASPQVLGDGEHILYAVNSTDPGRAGTYFGTLTSASRDDRRVLPEWGELVAYAPSGHLVFIRNQVVMAQPFDAASGELRGEPVPVSGTMVRNPAVSVSSHGLLSFGGGDAGERLAWLDRQGRVTSTLAGLGAIRNLVLSPDERRLLGDSAVQPLPGSWLFDLERNVPARVSPPAGRQPHWSPDGTRIAFTAQHGDVRGIYVRPVSHMTPELLLDTEEVKFVNDWTDDGRYLLFVSSNVTTRQDLWILPTLGDDRRPRALLRTPANELQGQVSPDGRWIAYASDESGRYEVYVDSFPTPGAKMTISNGGGGQPQWRRDGRELFYLGLDGSLMSVDVSPGPALQVGRSQALFRITLPGTVIDDRNLYAVSSDGRRFLVASVEETGAREPIIVLANWASSLPLPSR